MTYYCERCGMNMTKDNVDLAGGCFHCGGRFASTKPDLTPNQLVVATENFNEYKKGDVFIYLGEIVQMRGHCIVVDRKGKVSWGMHTERFRAPREGEI